MGTVVFSPQSNRGHPLIDEASILPRAHDLAGTDLAWEHEVIHCAATPQQPCCQVRAGVRGDFKLHGPSGLPLDNHCAVPDFRSGHEVINLKLHQIAAPQLGVDRQIEQGAVTKPLLAVCSVGPHFADQLAKDELDLALVTPTIAPDTLRARRLFNEDYVCILREGHPAGDRPDLKTLCELDHAIMSHDGTKFTGATDAALARLGHNLRVVAALPSFLVLVELVRASDVIALLSRRLARGQGGVVTAEPSLAIDGFQKIAVWHERVHHDPAHRWLREQLFEVVSQVT